MSDRKDVPQSPSSRRAFLERLLRTGAYVSPSVLVLSMRKGMQAQATCLPGNHHGACNPAPPPPPPPHH